MFKTARRLIPQLVTPSRAYSTYHSVGADASSHFRSTFRIAVVGTALGCAGYSWVTADNGTKDASTLLSPTCSEYKYLICGGGIAALEALKVFAEAGADGDVLLVSPEWGGKWHQTPDAASTSERKEGGLFARLATGFSEAIPLALTNSAKRQSAELVIGPRVSEIDTSNRIAILDNGTRVSFERCLIAVGSAMSDIPLGKVVSQSADDLVSGAQTTSDWNRIESVIRAGFGNASKTEESRAHLTVVGGGWMSTAVGAALVDRGADVTFSHAEPAFLARYFPKYLAQDLYSRLVWLSGGGVDALSYSALRYVIARTPLEQSFRPFEAEVHVGTVFDAFSIVDFRTDHVVFAPTVSPNVPIALSAAVGEDGGLVVNPELAAASDIYVAGAAISVGSGVLNYPSVMRWSADHAKATGRHAARNILGAREAYKYHPHLTVELRPLALRLHIFGDVNGSSESFGYFQRSKSRGESTAGGQLEVGALFCVKPAPLSHRGAAQKLVISGVALWEGSDERQIPDVAAAKAEAEELLGKAPMSRPELENVMDGFALDKLKISLFAEIPQVAHKPLNSENAGNNIGAENENAEGEDLEPVAETRDMREMRRPSPRVVWRRHRAARLVKVRRDELLWVADEWEGAASPKSKKDKKAEAYSTMLKKGIQG